MYYIASQLFFFHSHGNLLRQPFYLSALYGNDDGELQAHQEQYQDRKKKKRRNGCRHVYLP